MLVNNISDLVSINTNYVVCEYCWLTILQTEEEIALLLANN